MYVPSYQMHNVLNVYSKQLRQNLASEGKDNEPERPQTDRVNLSPEGKLQATIEKVSRDIIDKISRYGSRNEPRQGLTEYTNVSSDKGAMPHKAEIKTFVFNAIDTINKKSKNTLSVDDSSFLIQRLEQLAKKAGHKKTESGI